MKKRRRLSDVLMLTSLFIAFGVVQAALSYRLLLRTENLFGLEEDRRLVELARDYSRELGETDTSGLKVSPADAELIRGRGAFLAAFSRFSGQLFLGWALSSAAVTLAAAGAVFFLGAGVVRRDERRALQAEAERALAQWRATGRLIVHEVKNRLSPVSVDVEYLQSRFRALAATGPAGTPPDADACFGRIESNVDRVSRLLGTFRELSALPEPSFAVVRPGAILVSCLERNALGALLARDPSGGLESRKAFSDPEYLDIVFTNLVMNAREAGATRLAAYWKNRTLVLADDGPGLPSGLLERLSEGRPLAGFTTKRDGGGTGLSVAFELCALLGVALTLRNGERGTRAEMEFAHG